MEAGYTIVHDTNIEPTDTVMEVINWQSDNIIQFYAWGNPKVETEYLRETIGIWKIKKLNND